MLWLRFLFLYAVAQAAADAFASTPGQAATVGAGSAEVVSLGSGGLVSEFEKNRGPRPRCQRV